MMNYLGLVTDWVEGHRAELESQGGQVSLQLSRDDRPKHSVFVSVIAPDRFVELIVWASGEAEYGYGGAEQRSVAQRYELRSLADLEELLEVFRCKVRAD